MKSKAKDNFRPKSRSQSGIRDCNVSIVVEAIHIDNVQLMAKNARVVARKTILLKCVVLEAKAKDRDTLVVRDHSNIGRSM